MSHARDMANRLPQLYRDGELIRDLLKVPGLQLEILDEEVREVQRAHWFDSALELAEAAKLAAVLDIPPETWQTIGLYRVWVHSLRDAMLQKGAVTQAALIRFVEQYAESYQRAIGSRVIPTIQTWTNAPSTRAAAFVETPPRRIYERAPTSGGLEPLHQFSLVQRGLDDTLAGFLLVGLPSAPESVPVLVNVTTGQALIFLGNIPPGARLWIRPTPEGGVEANLEGVDVTNRMRSVSGVQPGTAWANSAVEMPAKAITLKRGKNDLWFLPIAHFDALGLDRFLLALADLLLHEGRYDQTQFDHALFYHDPAVFLRISWLETQPASFEICLPAGTLLSRAGRLNDALQDRARLESSLNGAIQKLKAAGVQARLLLKPFEEIQGQRDRITAIGPLVHREVGPTGADNLPDMGGIFEVSSFEDSTYR